MISNMTTNNQILSPCCFDYINHIGHSNHSCLIIEKRFIIYLKILSPPHCLIDWISLEHKRQFIGDIKCHQIIGLNSNRIYIILSADSVEHPFIQGLNSNYIIGNSLLIEGV